MTRRRKVFAIAGIALLGAAIPYVLLITKAVVIPILYMMFWTESIVVEGPAGLGEVRFTKSGFGRDGPTTLTVDARRRGDWSWTLVGEFSIFRGFPEEFQEARWATNGEVILIYTHYDVGPSSSASLADDRKTIISMSEYPGWKRDTATHAYDFRHGRVLAPEAATPEAIDAASAQIKAVMGEGNLSSPIAVLH